MGLFDEYQLVKTSTVTRVVKEPMTVKEMMQNSINKQRVNGVDDKRSWWKKGKVRPVCGIFKVINDDKDGFEVPKENFGKFLDTFENEFNSGGLDSYLNDVEKRQKEAIEKRKFNRKMVKPKVIEE